MIWKLKRCTSHIQRVVMALATLAMLPTLAHSAATFDRGKYFEFKGKVCGGAAACASSFTAIPAGKFVVLQRVTCQLLISNTVRIKNLDVRRMIAGETQNAFSHLFPVQEIADSNGNKHYLVNAETLIVLNPGDVPQVVVQTTANATIVANCSLLGTFTTT